MNDVEPTTDLQTNTIATALRRVFSEKKLDRIARNAGLMSRKRDVTPLALLVACLSTLGTGKVQWLADVLRTFNRFAGKTVRYKPGYGHLES